jgi:hypothetical protein
MTQAARLLGVNRTTLYSRIGTDAGLRTESAPPAKGD